MHSTVGKRQVVDVGSRIRDARTHSGLTQIEVAKATGLHVNALSNIENGHTSRPKEETLDKIAKALGRPLEEILGPPPIQVPEQPQVDDFLERFRRDNPRLFDGWSPEMWKRQLELAHRFGVANNNALARHCAKRVIQEFECIEQLRELFDADEEREVVNLLRREHSRCRLNAMSVSDETQRVDRAHDLPPTHKPAPIGAV